MAAEARVSHLFAGRKMISLFFVTLDKLKEHLGQVARLPFYQQSVFREVAEVQRVKRAGLKFARQMAHMNFQPLAERDSKLEVFFLHSRFLPKMNVPVQQNYGMY